VTLGNLVQCSSTHGIPSSPIGFRSVFAQPTLIPEAANSRSNVKLPFSRAAFPRCCASATPVIRRDIAYERV
jgi:hypothetical protein